MQLAAIKGNADARNITEISTGATDCLERLMALPYDDADLNDTNGDGVNGLDHTDNPAADHSRSESSCTVYWNVAVDSPTAGNKTIRVITTSSLGGNEKRVSLDFIK